jgi:hypothetical protein
MPLPPPTSPEASVNLWNCVRGLVSCDQPRRFRYTVCARSGPPIAATHRRPVCLGASVWRSEARAAVDSARRIHSAIVACDVRLHDRGMPSTRALRRLHSVCRTPRQIKARSQNLRHENVAPALTSYGTIDPLAPLLSRS